MGGAGSLGMEWKRLPAKPYSGGGGGQPLRHVLCVHRWDYQAFRIC